MKSKLTLCALMGAALALSACATAVRGTTSEVKFTSDPEGASVKTSFGKTCTTPCSMQIARNVAFQASFDLDGQTREVDVKTEVSGEGATAMAGNILFGGLIGAGIDASNGANLDHVPNPVHADFKDAAAPASTDPAKQDDAVVPSS